MWDHLPLELHGAVFEPTWTVRIGPWPGDSAYWLWHWIDAEGNRERCTSTEWHWRGVAPMADTMRHWWVWWIITDRDDALRADEYIQPWRMGDLEFSLSTGWQGWPKGPQ